MLLENASVVSVDVKAVAAVAVVTFVMVVVNRVFDVVAFVVARVAVVTAGGKVVVLVFVAVHVQRGSINVRQRRQLRRLRRHLATMLVVTPVQAV